MKKQMKIRLSALKNRMVFRLWAFMMIPVMFGIGFMWVVQIFLFEQNYANAAVNEALDRLSPVMEDLRTRDIGEDEKLLSLSATSAESCSWSLRTAPSSKCTPLDTWCSRRNGSANSTIRR